MYLVLMSRYELTCSIRLFIKNSESIHFHTMRSSLTDFSTNNLKHVLLFIYMYILVVYITFIEVKNMTDINTQ